jgi:dienelactone hydrolase
VINSKPVSEPSSFSQFSARPIMRHAFSLLSLFALLSTASVPAANAAEPLPGTQPLSLQGDIASNLVAGVDRFLLREIGKSVEQRAKFWNRKLASPGGYPASIQPNQARLAHILGLRDKPAQCRSVEFVGTSAQPALVGAGDGYQVFAVRWPAFGDVHGEGLLLAPTNRPKVADVVAIPDADQTPELIAGLVEGAPAHSQYARRLAESGCRVLVPALINRQTGQPKTPGGNRGANLSNREFVYRSAYELGRHLIGYEVGKVRALVDWLVWESAQAKGNNQRSPIGIIGWGEGGLLALYTAALDQRFDAVCVSGYFDRREDVWQEPICRNVFGLLEQFGDAELASMTPPAALIIEAAQGPEIVVPPGTGGGPGRLLTPKLENVRAEVQRARQLLAGLQPPPQIHLVISGEGAGPYGSEAALKQFLDGLAPGTRLAPLGNSPVSLRKSFDPAPRHQRQLHELDRHNQWLLAESPYARQQFMAKLDTSSLANYQQSAEAYREHFYQQVIGRFDQPLLPPNPRSRKAYDEPKWTGYEVVLDVLPDVISYGVLLLPKDLKPGQRRPVVVCQHGLEGRPQHVITGNQEAYHDFAAKLAERGFVTYAPQNLYLFGDRFRTLQRKANPLGKTLFSIIVPQHQQLTDWLKTLPFVDPGRIAFYGLSYGGKTAMRVPPLVKNYCLSICSADFNEWVWKNASTSSPYSYVWTGEYEIFEFDLGNTFNYAEMAALIAPRPFMVERGHFDGVAPDETVGYEFAKVRHLYEARLGLGDRCQIEWFVGPHTINGKGTFDFLHRCLSWPQP